MAAYFQDAGEDEPLSAAAESGNGSVYLLLRREEMGCYLQLLRREEMDRYLLLRREETDWHLPLLWKLYGSRFLPCVWSVPEVFWLVVITEKFWEVVCKWEKYMVMYV